MKRYSKSILGVTLLEVMLVLAIAGMVIVMSIRYYESANTSEQINTLVEQVEAIAVAAETAEQSTGSFSNIGNASSFAAMLPKNGLVPPWGGSQISTSGTSVSYVITIPNVPYSVCGPFALRVSANTHYSSTCTGMASGGSGNVSVTYTP